jgi:membrane dipeptidase
MTDHKCRGSATLSLPELRRSGAGVVLATVLSRAKREVQPLKGHMRYEIDFGTQAIAYAMGKGQLAYYRAMEQQGQMKMLRTAADLDAHWRQWTDAAERDPLPVGYILAMEGADPILEPSQAQEWWDEGLRSVTLSHYGKSHYSVGTGDNGPLTAKGREILKEFDRLGMILDLTHMSDISFFEALDLFHGPVMASHNNCRALVPGDRQFSDEQLKLLIARGAVIGAVLDAWMLYPGWVRGSTKPDVVTLAAVIDNVDHICQLAGNTDHVAIGSDLDGGYGTEQTPRDVKIYRDLQKLDGIMQGRGYSDHDIDKFFHGNWLRFFRQWLPKK